MQALRWFTRLWILFPPLALMSPSSCSPCKRITRQMEEYSLTSFCKRTEVTFVTVHEQRWSGGVKLKSERRNTDEPPLETVLRCNVSSNFFKVLMAACLCLKVTSAPTRGQWFYNQSVWFQLDMGKNTVFVLKQTCRALWDSLICIITAQKLHEVSSQVMSGLCSADRGRTRPSILTFRIKEHSSFSGSSAFSKLFF